MKLMTATELLALPATTDLPTAARALGIGATTAYELHNRGEFPVRTLKLGRKIRVVTSELLACLGVETELETVRKYR